MFEQRTVLVLGDQGSMGQGSRSQNSNFRDAIGLAGGPAAGCSAAFSRASVTWPRDVRDDR